MKVKLRSGRSAQQDAMQAETLSFLPIMYCLIIVYGV